MYSSFNQKSLPKVCNVQQFRYFATSEMSQKSSCSNFYVFVIDGIPTRKSPYPLFLINTGTNLTVLRAIWDSKSKCRMLRQNTQKWCLDWIPHCNRALGKSDKKVCFYSALRCVFKKQFIFLKTQNFQVYVVLRRFDENHEIYVNFILKIDHRVGCDH